jgi:hypothetical protein
MDMDEVIRHALGDERDAAMVTYSVVRNEEQACEAATSALDWLRQLACCGLDHEGEHALCAALTELNALHKWLREQNATGAGSLGARHAR